VNAPETVIDFSDLKDGVYTINILQSSHVIASKKIIKTH
jgi:hypothetical protein